jgi:hypothetical protein
MFNAAEYPRIDAAIPVVYYLLSIVLSGSVVRGGMVDLKQVESLP